MTVYFSSDLTFLELQNLVLRSLKEPESVGSEAVSLDLVKDTINIVYSEAFNDQRMKQSAREADISFNLANDTTLSADVAAAAVTIPLTDSSSWRAAGKILLTSEIADYTGNAANTLTGVTSLNIAHQSGEVARQLYPLSSIASTLESEQIQYLNVNGIPQQYMGYENLITPAQFYPNTYGIYKGHLMFSPQAQGAPLLPKVLMVYTEKVVPLSATTDKAVLIPNSWRIPILVYGACMKIAAEDAFRTSWEFWEKAHATALSQYIAFKNNRTRDRSNKSRPVAGGYSLWR